MVKLRKTLERSQPYYKLTMEGTRMTSPASIVNVEHISQFILLLLLSSGVKFTHFQKISDCFRKN